MMKKIVALSCLAWATVAISSATSANAVIATPLSGDRVTVTNSASSFNYTNCYGNFFYLQRMKIDGAGGASFVNTDVVYASGRYTMNLVAECELDNIYALGVCSC